MTCNVLISWRQLWYVLLPNSKIWSDVFHLFSYGLPPKGIAVLFVKCLCLLRWLGDLDAKLVRSNPILRLQISNDTVAFFQHMPHPLCKWRVSCNTAMYRILGHLYRIWVLHIFEVHPSCSTILPLYEAFNPLHCFSATLCSSMRRDERVLLIYFSTQYDTSLLTMWDTPIHLPIDVIPSIDGIYLYSVTTK